MNLDADRLARAAAALEDGQAPRRGKGPGIYTVPSFTSDATYTVNLPDRSCTCPDHRFHGSTCKHLCAVALVRGLS